MGLIVVASMSAVPILPVWMGHIFNKAYKRETHEVVVPFVLFYCPDIIKFSIKKTEKVKVVDTSIGSLVQCEKNVAVMFKHLNLGLIYFFGNEKKIFQYKITKTLIF